MGDSALNDPKVFPSEDVLGEKLGRAAAAYRGVFDYLASDFPGIAGEWKFYNDGKCWLQKVSRKGKTAFWLSVSPGFFRTTFYLSAAMGDIVEGSDLPEDAKASFRASSGKKFRGITLALKAKKDLEAFKEALAIKLAGM
jgi:hypothetical protein